MERGKTTSVDGRSNFSINYLHQIFSKETILANIFWHEYQICTDASKLYRRIAILQALVLLLSKTCCSIAFSQPSQQNSFSATLLQKTPEGSDLLISLCHGHILKGQKQRLPICTPTMSQLSDFQKSINYIYAYCGKH